MRAIDLDQCALAISSEFDLADDGDRVPASETNHAKLIMKHGAAKSFYGGKETFWRMIHAGYVIETKEKGVTRYWYDMEAIHSACRRVAAAKAREARSQNYTPAQVCERVYVCDNAVPTLTQSGNNGGEKE